MNVHTVNFHFVNTGILAAAWPCGIIVYIGELHKAESKGQVYGQLHQFLNDNPAVASDLGMSFMHDICISQMFTEYIVYDDSCHLMKFATNKKRINITETAHMLSNKKFVVDKFHMKGHIDQWCKLNCDPAKFEELANVCS
jgi:hypothetical protein